MNPITSGGDSIGGKHGCGGDRWREDTLPRAKATPLQSLIVQHVERPFFVLLATLVVNN